MRIIRNRTIQTDPWRLSPEQSDSDNAEAIGDSLIVPLDRLIEEAEVLIERASALGVLLRPADDPSQLEPYLRHLALVAIEFPKFNEGRGYSQARVLRNRYGFTGEIRAVGDVSRDRLAFLERCGFNSFALREGEPLDAALAAFSEISLKYQPGEDAGDTIRCLRRRRAGLAS